MSADTENICMNFASIHEMWASPIECGVALYLLYRQLGMAFLAPMVVAIGLRSLVLTSSLLTWD